MKNKHISFLILVQGVTSAHDITKFTVAQKTIYTSLESIKDYYMEQILLRVAYEYMDQMTGNYANSGMSTFNITAKEAPASALLIRILQGTRFWGKQ